MVLGQLDTLMCMDKVGPIHQILHINEVSIEPRPTCKG